MLQLRFTLGGLVSIKLEISEELYGFLARLFFVLMLMCIFSLMRSLFVIDASPLVYLSFLLS